MKKLFIAADEAKGIYTVRLFINGRFLSGAQPYENFKRVVDELLKG